MLPSAEAARDLFDDFALDTRVLQELYPETPRLRVLQQLEGDALHHGCLPIGRSGPRGASSQGAILLRGFFELAAELPLQQLKEGLLILREIALLGGDHLFEVLGLARDHLPFQIVLYHARADV
jgi:hypothetical protein